MVEIDDCIKARSFITSLKVLDNQEIAFATKLHGAKICESDRCEVILNFANEHLNSNTTAICFSNDGRFLAFANDKIIYIVDIILKKIVKTIDTDTESIQILSFDESSKHLVAGSSNGRVLHYKTDGLSLLCRLCSFPYNRAENENIRQNYVSALTFKGSTLAACGYGGTIHIIDIHSRANTIVLNNGKTRTNALCFLGDYKLITGNFDGLIKIFHIKKKKLIKQIESPLSRIRQIVIMPNPNFAMICSNTNYVSILDIKNFKLIHSNYIEFSDQVTRIAILNDNTMLVSLKNGQIKKVNLPSEKELESLILHNSLEKAFLLAEGEPMLQDTEQYKKLESLYTNLYNKATKALVNQHITLANEITKPFAKLKSKKKEINSLFIAFKNYDRLKIFFIEKKYTLAYAITARYPELENTPIYKKMEEDFKLMFRSAQKHMLLGQPHNARSLLNAYILIPAKKSLIELILKQNKQFLEFIVAVDKNDYAKACSLAQRNKLLIQIPSHSILTKNLDKYLDNIKDSIKKGDAASAYKTIEILKDIIHLKSQVRILKSEVKNLEELQKNYTKDDFKSCYETIDRYPHLIKTELGTLLCDHWSKLTSTCEAYALKGNVTEIKNTLGELISLEARLNKIGDLFRVAYHIRIKTYIYKRAYPHAEKTIYSYIDTFGNDSELNTLMKKFEDKSKKKLAITQDSAKRVTRNSWVTSSLINDGN